MPRRAVPKPSRLSPIVTACVLVAALYFAQEVLIPLALALLLSFLLAPAVRRLERRGLRRVGSVVVVAAVAFAVIFSVGWVVAEQVVHVAERLPRYEDEIVNKVRRVRGQGSALAERIVRMGREIEKASTETRPATAPENLSDPRTPTASPPDGTLVNPVYTIPLPAPRSPLSSLGQYLGLALGPLATGALVVVFTIFMLLEQEELRDRLIRLVSGGHYMVTTRALNDAGKRISRYMLAQSVVNGTYGLVIGAGLWIIGLVLGGGQPFPSFVLWGLLCAVLRFIPYIGPWVAALFPLALSLAVYPGFTVFVATACLFVLLEIVSNNLMEPWLYGASTGMSTVAVLAAAVFWTWLWGPVGLLLATPLTVCIVVVGKYVPRLRFLDVLLGDRPALPRHVTYYQRLLAGDAEEAARVAEEHAREHGLDSALDAVLVPALRLARWDRREAGLSADDEAFIRRATAEALRRLAAPGARPGPPPVSVGALVLGCPAHHQMEELVVDMLALVALADGASVRGVSTRTLPVQVEEQIAQENPAVVFVAVLPPGGLAQARHLCRRLRRRFPALPVVVGYFGKAREFDRLLVRLRRSGASYVTTSLAQTRSQVRALLASSPTAPAAPAAAAED